MLRWEDAHAAAYKLQLSDDGRSWRDVYEAQNAPGGEETIRLPLQQARYVRMLGLRRATQWGYSLYELEVYRRDAKAPKLSPVHFIRLELTDRDERLLSDNFYWRAARRGDYTALNTLAPARLQVHSRLFTEAGRKVIRTTVRNIGRSVAFAVHVQPYPSRTANASCPMWPMTTISPSCRARAGRSTSNSTARCSPTTAIRSGLKLTTANKRPANPLNR